MRAGGGAARARGDLLALFMVPLLLRLCTLLHSMCCITCCYCH